LWEACQDLEAPVHWHSSAGLQLMSPRWKGFTNNQYQAAHSSGSFSVQSQFVPNLILSGLLDRFPRLRWVCAETGVGWVSFVLQACDHEWEQRKLWNEGIKERPSDLFRRQVSVNFWFERVGLEQRHAVGVDNIMWESDYPHSTSTYPESWKFVNHATEGIPESERNKLLYENALRLYRF
jgi:predicted TIM-barrel fold metal-dependent hydrolase